MPIVTEVTALGRGRESVVMHSFSVATALPSGGRDPLVPILANRLGTGGIQQPDPATDGPRPAAGSAILAPGARRAPSYA